MAIFKKVKLSEVLNWVSDIKRLKPVEINKYTTENSVTYPFYGQQLANNGVIDYISVDERFLNNKDNKVYLLIASNNHSISIVTTPFYLKEDHAATSVIGHSRMTVQSALYIRGSIQKVFDTSFDYNAKALQGVLQNTVVSLPFLHESSEELDWDYMCDYIENLKKKSVDKIRRFVDKRGYGTGSASVLPKRHTEMLDGESRVAFQKFRIEQLFDVIKRGRRIRSIDRIAGNLPFYTAGTENMGFSAYIGNKDTEIFPSDSITIDMFGNTYYRGYEYGADDHVTVLYNSQRIYSRKVLQYMQTVIGCAIHGKFSYSRNFYPSDANGVEIFLPVKVEQEIDLEYMEDYITAIENKIMNTLLIKLDNSRTE